MACSVVMVSALPRSFTSAAIASRLRIELARRRADQHDAGSGLRDAVTVRIGNGAYILRPLQRKIADAPGIERRLDQADRGGWIVARRLVDIAAEITHQ